MRKTLLSTLALALVLFTGARLSAQELKPVAVLSVASYQTLQADLKFAGELAETPGLDAMADGMLQMVTRGALTKSLDKTKPFGALVLLEGQQPKVLAFLPIADLKGVLAVVYPAPATENDGCLEIPSPNGDTIYAVQKGSWALVSNEKGVVKSQKDSMDDPEKLLDGLDKKYAVAFRLNVQNIPADLRTNFGQLLRSLVEVSLVQSPGEDEIAFEFRKKMVQGQLKQFDAFIKESDQLTLGWAIDPTAKTTFLDMSLTAVAGSDTARKLSGGANAKSEFGGFLLSDAAFNFNVCKTFEPADLAQVLAVIQTARQKANQAIDNDPTIPNSDPVAPKGGITIAGKDFKEGEAIPADVLKNATPDERRKLVLTGKDVAKSVVKQLLDVAENTLKSGKIDGGAALSLAPASLAFAAGGFIKDGPTLDAAVRELVSLAGNDPSFPRVKFDAETYKGVKVHTAAIPMMDDNAKKMFGDTMDFYLGIGPESVYVAFGKDSLAMVKSIIDKPSAGSTTGKYFAQANVALGPILKFIDANHPDPHLAVVAKALDGAPGKDHIRLLEGVIANGVNLQIQLEEGVLKAIGTAIKEQAGMGGRGR